MNEPDDRHARPCRSRGCRRAHCHHRRRPGDRTGPRFAAGLLIQLVLALVNLFRE